MRKIQKWGKRTKTKNKCMGSLLKIRKSLKSQHFSAEMKRLNICFRPTQTVQ